MRASPATRPPHLAFLAIVIIPVASHLIIWWTRHIHLGLSTSFGGLFKLGFVTVSVITHWGIYASVLAGFALTLRPGHTPLITAMARRMHGPLSAEMLSYTRKVTIAWVLFFVVQLSISVGLFCFGSLVAWSFFVNIMDIPLVALMFAAEYAIRLRVLRDPPRHSLKAIIGMICEAFPNEHSPVLATEIAEPEA